MTARAAFRDDCPFCDIARGAARKTNIIFETASWMAFFPLNPATLGHTLVIPKQHTPNLWQVSDAMGSELMTAAIKVGNAIDAALDPPGMNLISSAGKAAEQSVFHLHLHVVPRWKGDNFDAIWPDSGVTDEQLLANAASDIRKNLSL